MWSRQYINICIIYRKGSQLNHICLLMAPFKTYSISKVPDRVYNFYILLHKQTTRANEILGPNLRVYKLLKHPQASAIPTYHTHGDWRGCDIASGIRILFDASCKSNSSTNALFNGHSSATIPRFHLPIPNQDTLLTLL